MSLPIAVSTWLTLGHLENLLRGRIAVSHPRSPLAYLADIVHEHLAGATARTLTQGKIKIADQHVLWRSEPSAIAQVSPARYS